MDERRVRICDIAEELGLSTATVSNVLHGKTGRVSPETARRVQALLEERQYIPSMAGVLLAQNSSRIIGVALNDHEKYEARALEDGFVASTLGCLSAEIERSGRFMMVKRATDFDEIARFASMWNLDGLVLMGFCRQDYAALRGRMRIPLVVFDGYPEPAEVSVAGAAAAVLNTLLNDLLIFGHGVAAMGTKGAALATLIAQWANLMLLILLCHDVSRPLRRAGGEMGRFNWKQYAAMLLPVLACELMWSLGENVYAGVYGHVGRQVCAAMTLTAPAQSLTIGALCGLSQAAGVLVGKALGRGDGEGAYRISVRLLLYGLIGAAMLSVAILCAAPLYVRLFRVEAEVRAMTRQILTAYALVAPVKVLNMILGSGILRSGGRTKLVMWIDLIGTWGFGVPLACLGGFALHLPIAQLYFLLSMEECVRLALSLHAMKRRRWMCKLEA